MTEPEFRGLLDRYLEGKASPEERKLLDQFFDSYRDKNPDVSVMSSSLDPGIRDEILKEIRERKRPDIEIVPLRRSATWLRIAAAILFVMVASYLLITYLYMPGAEVSNVVAVRTIDRTTGRGQKTELELPDGTHVKLNSNSGISYPETFNGSTREITLIGEAYFEVAHDATKPFIVHTENISTKVLGTSFNVNANTKLITVTLVEGKVNILTPDEDVILLPNHQAVIKSGTSAIDTQRVDVSTYTAWTNNRLIFENMPLQEAFVILENWYNVDIHADNEALKNCVITAKYENESLENVLSSFRFMLKMDYTIDNHRVTVSGKGCN
jgi:transmembrane sensor